MCVLKVTHQRGKGDVGVAEGVSAEQVAHTQEGAGMHIVFAADELHGAVAETERNSEAADGGQQHRVV